MHDGADVLMTSVMQDVGGRVTKQDDGAAWGAGRTLNTYAYDATDALTKVDTGALTKATLGYMIDAGSRLSKHTLEYDRIGRVTKHQFGSDNTGNVHRLKWEYRYDDSNAGRLWIAAQNPMGYSESKVKRSSASRLNRAGRQTESGMGGRGPRRPP